MKALFIPCSIDGLPKDSGSIRLRCLWPARYWEGAEVYDGTQRLTNFDAFIFQKAYLGDQAQELIWSLSGKRDAGEPIRLAFDLVDPDLLDREHERRMSQVISLFDFVVTSTDRLAQLVNETYTVPVRVIPDRVDLDELGELVTLGQHHDSGSDKPVLVWAGYVGAIDALLPMSWIVNELGLRFKILANEKPIPFGEFWRRVMGAGDILLNPRAETGVLSYKSDNKTVIAWALGMPVARSVADVRYLCSPDARKNSIHASSAIVAESYDVRQSAVDWERLFAEAGLE